MKTVLVSADLMLVSSAAGIGDRCGAGVIAAATGDDALRACLEQAPVQAAILDLRTPGLDAATLVPQLRNALGPGGRVVAFAPHVHVQSLEAARAAGCDEVFTRGQFDACVALMLQSISSATG